MKEALNPNSITMQDLIDDENLPPTTVLLTDLHPDQTIHYQDEDVLLATYDLSEDKNMSPPEDTSEELLEYLLAYMDDPITTAPLSNASLDHSSLIDASASVPLMNGMHDNATLAVPTQEAAAHVPPLTTTALWRLPVTSVMRTQEPPLTTTLQPEFHVPPNAALPHNVSFHHSSLMHVSTSITIMYDIHASTTLVAPTQVPPLTSVLPLEFPVLPTTASPPNVSFDHSSLTHASTSMPPMENMHANDNLVAPTQVPPLPDVLLPEFTVPLNEALPQNALFHHSSLA